MKIKNASAWAPLGMRPWLISLGILLGVFCLRWALHPWLKEHMPLTFFVVAAMYVQYRYGLSKAIVVALLGCLIGDFMFTYPFAVFDDIDDSDLLLQLQFFLLVATCMIIIQRLRNSQYQNRLMTLVAESRYLMLLQSESDRKAAEQRDSAHSIAEE